MSHIKNIAVHNDSGKFITNWKVNVLGSEYSVLKSKYIILLYCFKLG